MTDPSRAIACVAQLAGVSVQGLMETFTAEPDRSAWFGTWLQQHGWLEDDDA